MHFNEAPMLLGNSSFNQLASLRRDPMGMILRVSSEETDILRVRMPGGTIGIVTSPATLHDVLVAKARSFEKSPVLRLALEPLAGKGLFTSEGELWRKQRRLMAPIFQPQQLGHYATCMRECAERVALELRDGETVDVAHETMRIAMSVAGKALFDSDTFSDADQLGAAITVALQWANDASASISVIFQGQLRTRLAIVADRLPEPLRGAAKRAVVALDETILWPGERTKKLREAMAVLDARVARMIEERRKATEPRSDLLTRLLNARDEDDGSRMSDKQVRDEILTLFVAGHETTATALAWSLYFLARDPAAYEQIRQEVDALKGEVTLDDLPRLGYSLKVFKESLRIHPPIYLFGRQAIVDVEVGGWFIPRGTILLVSPYATQHRRDLWPDPERFDPERFTPEAEAARHRASYLPFSAGPRTCIGNHFALMEGPIVLATLLQRADFELVSKEPVGLHASATLRPKGGIPMRARLR